MEMIDKPSFSFNETPKSITAKEIEEPNHIKSSESNDIPKNLIKEVSDMFATIISLLKILKNALMVALFHKVSKYWLW